MVGDWEVREGEDWEVGVGGDEEGEGGITVDDWDGETALVCITGEGVDVCCCCDWDVVGGVEVGGGGVDVVVGVVVDGGGGGEGCMRVGERTRLARRRRRTPRPKINPINTGDKSPTQSDAARLLPASPACGKPSASPAAAHVTSS